MLSVAWSLINSSRGLRLSYLFGSLCPSLYASSSLFPFLLTHPRASSLPFVFPPFGLRFLWSLDTNSPEQSSLMSSPSSSSSSSIARLLSSLLSSSWIQLADRRIAGSLTFPRSSPFRGKLNDVPSSFFVGSSRASTSRCLVNGGWLQSASWLIVPWILVVKALHQPDSIFPSIRWRVSFSYSSSRGEDFEILDI